MLTVAFIIISCILLIWMKRNTNKNEPPAIPGSLPLIGHAHLLIGDGTTLWNALKILSVESLKAGGVISAYIGPRTIYVVTDPDDFIKIANTCLEKDNFYKFAKPWLGDGLLTADLSIWKVHRKLLNPAFSQIVVDGFLEAFNHQSRRLVKDLEVEVGKGPFDHSIYTRHNALETICLTAMGVDFTDKNILNSKYVHATEEMLHILAHRFQRFWLHNHLIFVWTPLKREQDECVKILQNMSDSVLKRRKADYLNGNIPEVEGRTKGLKLKPFMDLLLELAAEKGVFSDREIREHVDTIIATGHDTTASVLMYTMLLIGSYPEVQERVFQELHAVFGDDDDREVTKYDLSQLIYLEAVLKETIRLYPIAPVTARLLDTDIKLRNCTLSKGRTCFMLVYGIHRHPMWGPDAESFKPERWLEPGKLPENPNAYAGFGMGKRSCIGKSYAYMSMKTTLAHICRHYKICGDYKKLEIKVDILMKPISGHHITIEKRKNLAS